MSSAIVRASSSSLAASKTDRPSIASTKGSASGALRRIVAMRSSQSAVLFTGTRDSAKSSRRAANLGFHAFSTPLIWGQFNTSPRSRPNSPNRFLREFCGCCSATFSQDRSGLLSSPGRTMTPFGRRETQAISRAVAPSVPVEPAMIIE